MPGPELGAAFGDAITAGYGAYERGLNRKQVEKKLQQQMALEQLREEVRLMTAHLQANSRETVAREGAGARRYAADASYDAADRRSRASEYGADQSSGARRYAADMSYAGQDRAAGSREYSADQGLVGRRYAADRSLEGARTHADAARYGADTSASARRDVAKTMAGASGNRGIMSLYGNLLRPRPTQYDAKGNPVAQSPAPKFSDWMQQSGIQSLVSGGQDDNQDDQDDAAALDDGSDDDPNADDPNADDAAPLVTSPPPARSPAAAAPPVAAPSTGDGLLSLSRIGLKPMASHAPLSPTAPAVVPPKVAAPVAPLAKPAGGAPPVQVGGMVTVKGGKRIKVTKVHPDGSFDGDEVKE